MKNLMILAFVLFLSGCVAKSVDVKKNSENIAENGKNVAKAFELIGTFHKDEKTEALNAQMREVAKAQFDESLKSKGLTVSEGLQNGVKAAGSITEMLGIPYGGIAMDIIGGVLGLFGGTKVVQNRTAQASARRKEEEDWKKYLASLTPDEAEKAIKSNGI